ncbi:MULTISPECIES: hypothetical protein [Clostridium]|uniref:Uncharacterized protein n=1 Tax=Clostridium novyi (strain NT) TaxID=386415 RepID=A0PZB4_CLONN|nr:MULTISPECIES: hypothetical protein [Clostridium]ABK61347.1 hypothetical protein NT01CX_1635 [Clostridium novyi NT]KEH87698.1 hypothetical protein Z966_10415 [Clostridium novyi A str. NCTC 538]KEH88788.1 hypothetical protein Z967_01080 [Clostridium novyi A str. 4540]KEH91539.1 hypothetical protein Z964_08925 [Clostridium novyi A str. GD211209]KEH91732.1 hypothetical protein Z963_08405 [Clostridium botulinum C/D str. It1]
MEDLKNNINNLKEKIKEVVKEIELELKNSKNIIKNIKEINPEVITSNLRNGDVYCSSMANAMASSDWYTATATMAYPNYSEFYAIAIGWSYAIAGGESLVSCVCGDFAPLQNKNGTDMKTKYISKFNKDIEENKEIKKLKESIKNKCQRIKGYVDEIIKITRYEQINNIDDDNIKIIKSNGVTLVCVGYASSEGYGDKASNSYSGVINNENLATSYSRADSIGNNVAIVYGYSYLDCNCKQC